MKSTAEENALKSRTFLLTWGVRILKKKVLEILDAIDAPVYMNLVDDSHGIPSKDSPKNVILKLSRGKDFRRVLLL